jgi:hypothetical protein
MNTDTLQLIGQILLIGLGPVLAKHGITLGNEDVDKVTGAIAFIGGVVWKFYHWNKTPTAPPSGGISVPIQKIASLLVLTAALAGILGCVPLQPGADPLIVRCEQAETIAKTSFDGVLSIDNSQRDFYRTSAPAFHNFCEWLRQPQTVEVTNTLPRATAMIVSLDDVKLAYKGARASSNDVWIALQTLTSAMGQANAWLSNGPTNSVLNP